MELLFTIFLLFIAKMIWGKPRKNRRGDYDRGDNYIILSELEQDHGKHDDDSGGQSIYDDDGGDPDF